MSPDQLKASLEKAEIMLNLIQNQRNAAQNEIIQVGAQLVAAQRRIEELEKRLKEFEVAEPKLPLNGHEARVS